MAHHCRGSSFHRSSTVQACIECQCVALSSRHTSASGRRGCQAVSTLHPDKAQGARRAAAAVCHLCCCVGVAFRVGGVPKQETSSDGSIAGAVAACSTCDVGSVKHRLLAANSRPIQ